MQLVAYRAQSSLNQYAIKATTTIVVKDITHSVQKELNPENA
jgi:hypothetical protein